MTWQHAELVIFGIGMAVIAYAAIRAARRSARELAELQRLGEADDYPVTRPCPWCPITPEDGATDDATKDDCTCGDDCGEPWCGRKPYMTTRSGA